MPAAVVGQPRALAAVPVSGWYEEPTQYRARRKRRGAMAREQARRVGAEGGAGRGDLADEDRVVRRARWRARPPRRRRRDPGTASPTPPLRVRDGLRGELDAEVGLVPDRPEVDPGQRGRAARRRVVTAVALTHGAREEGELLGRRGARTVAWPDPALPGRRPSGGVARRGRASTSMPRALRVADDRVVVRPAAGRIGGRIGGIEMRPPGGAGVRGDV